MECIISTMEDTYFLSLDHSLISGLITSSMFTLNTEKEDRKEKKKPWSCLSFFVMTAAWRLNSAFVDHSSSPPFPQRPHFHGVRGESAPKGMMGDWKGNQGRRWKRWYCLGPPGDYLLISEHLKRNSVGKRSKASIILNKRTRLIDFSHLYNFWKLDLS